MKNHIKKILIDLTLVSYKDGEQGIMTNNSKIKLSKLINDSNKFENFKSWKLQDGSRAKLFKRKKK